MVVLKEKIYWDTEQYGIPFLWVLMQHRPQLASQGYRNNNQEWKVYQKDIGPKSICNWLSAESHWIPGGGMMFEFCKMCFSFTLQLEYLKCL